MRNTGHSLHIQLDTEHKNPTPQFDKIVVLVDHGHNTIKKGK